ncbi:MAG: segregation/condensation protein A [Oscillospiraceae bacterium]|nr:segregation/condensation protein A [Oscillospiraceae bacterium]
METPVFRLEGIVRTKNEISDFEGPLTLILQLLSKDRVEIRDISISMILEQYLAYLAEMAELDLEIASEFVAMASHLAYIKTRMLLTGDAEVSELEQLISSLEELKCSDIYTQIKSAAETLAGMYTAGGAMMPGPPEYIEVDARYKYTHSSGDLREAVLRVAGREEAKIDSRNPRPPVFPERIVYPIGDKAAQIIERLKAGGDIALVDLFYGAGSRTELVATLIAILELCKVGNLLILGGSDAMVTFTGAGRELEIEIGEYTSAVPQ